MAELQITIDDGPHPVREALVPMLRELARYRVRAAFFNIGVEVHHYPQTAQVIRDQGHILANRSWDHLMPRTNKYTDDQIYEQFERCHREVNAAAGVIMQHWRAPRLEQISRISRLLVGPGKLYRLAHCDVNANSNDAQGVSDASGMLASLRTDIAKQQRRSTFRLLFHVESTTATAFPRVIASLLSDGHRLVDFVQNA